jgi:hypothetical protein
VGYAVEIGHYLEDFSKKIHIKSPDAKPLYMIYEGSRLSKASFDLSFLKYLMNRVQSTSKAVLVILKSIIKRDQANWYMIAKRARLSKTISIPNSYDLGLAKCRDRLKLFMRKREYLSVCSKLEDKKYIYLAAPLLPEGNNLPQALHNRRLSFLLNYLSESIPSDVFIALKINPAQFTTNQHWFSARSDWFGPAWFSDAQSMYKNLIFVDIDCPTLDLITNSIGVASISGSVSFEALASQKRSIVISENWFIGLDGIDLVGSVEETKNAITKMLLGVKPNPNFRKLFGDAGFIFPLQNPSEGAYSNEDAILILKAFKKAVDVFDTLPSEKWSI